MPIGVLSSYNADFECLQRLNMLNLQPLKMGVCKDI